MQEVELEKLVGLALEQKDDWHFHFLTPNCVFNDSDLFKVILETNNGKYVSLVDQKPLEELKKIENHFYNKPQ